MIVKKADFVTSMTSFHSFPTQGLPEIAFAGRSNVGKSSMINCITGRNGLARTSQRPGRTRLINVFCINEIVNLIDLPGYGFARVSLEERRAWGEMMDGYFSNTKNLSHVFHLVDIRHEPTAEDEEMTEFLRANEMPFTVIATKLDKISKTMKSSNIQLICRSLQIQPWQIIPFSSEKKEGRTAVLDLIGKISESTGSEQ